MSGYQRDSRWLRVIIVPSPPSKRFYFKTPLFFLLRCKRQLKIQLMAAKEMDDAGFWLPSEFLSDDLFAGEERVNELESDEDDLVVAGLAGQMSDHTFLNNEQKVLVPVLSPLY